MNTLKKLPNCTAPIVVVIAAFACLSTSARALTIYGNSATFGPDLVHEFDVTGTTGTLVQNTTVSTGNGRGIVIVGNTMYSTESGPSSNIFGGSNIIYKTDLTTGLSLGTITVGALPPGAAMSTLAWDGTHFWTSEYLGGNHAYQIDTSGNIVKTITLGLASSNMDGMEYFNGKLICNRADGGGPYDVYDLDGNVIQASFIDPGTFTTGIAFDGADFYTSNLSTLSQWDGLTGAFKNTITLSGGSFDIEDLSVDYAQREDTGGGGGGGGGGPAASRIRAARSQCWDWRSWGLAGCAVVNGKFKALSTDVSCSAVANGGAFLFFTVIPDALSRDDAIAA